MLWIFHSYKTNKKCTKYIFKFLVRQTVLLEQKFNVLELWTISLQIIQKRLIKNLLCDFLYAIIEKPYYENLYFFYA